ncbi:phage tail protein [Herbaspirillum sp. B65]|uniref:phage tail protein n=1 Tax=Herbaspirillum sp. B65 TaxID=137708 RepID=UPI0003474E6B|nr:phage tail protein [Herbaspirillum sp. B65]
MSTYFSIPTEIGEAKIANALALGVPLKLTHMGVGDGNGVLPVPDRKQVALVREQRRAPINTLDKDPKNASQIIIEQVLPADVGGWWVREIGIFDEAGDLCAVANCPPSYKPVIAEGAGKDQVVRVVLLVASTAAVELKIDPAVVLATRKYADDAIVAYAAQKGHTHADLAPLKSPQFSGIPTVPTPPLGTKSGQAINAEFLNATLKQVAPLRFAVFTSSGTFTVPDDVTALRVSAGGGGGGGGGAGGAYNGGGSGYAASGGGGGGGAASYLIDVLVPVTPGQVLNVVIGAGGAGGVHGGLDLDGQRGGKGGDTSLTGDGVNIVSTGGPGGDGTRYAGGAYVTLVGGAGFGNGGTPGTAGNATPGNGYSMGGIGGNGGNSPWGTGGGGGVSQSSTLAGGINGAAGIGYASGGGGGGGSVAGETARPGGDGAAGRPGILIIKW